MPAHHTSQTEPALVEQAALSRTAELMDAMVAAYALVAHVDGEVDPAERRRIFAVLRDNPAMSVFSRADIAEAIAAHEANYRMDPEIAEQIAREKLAFIAGDERQSRLVLMACRELIAADGIAHPSERRMLADIKALLHWTDPVPPRHSSATSVSRPW